MAFGFGFTDSSSESSSWNNFDASSNSQQQSSSFGNNLGIGSAQNSSAQNVWGGQSPFLQQLYGDIFNVGNPMGAAAAAQGGSDAVNPYLMAGLEGLGGLMDPSSQIAAQEASLASGLGDLFNNELMPGIARNAVGAGQLGGGRQGVAEGQAVGEIANAYTQGLGDITARANQQALGAAGMMPGFAQGIMSNVMSPFQQPMNILQMMAQALGGPTVLGQSQGTSDSFSMGQTGSQSSGSSQSTQTGRQGSQSESSSTGFNIGFQ